MKVWILQTGEPLHCDGGSPRPMRAMNLADAMVAAGHEVRLWSSAFYHQEKRQRCTQFQSIVIHPTLTIELIPSPGYRRNVGPDRLFDHAVLARNLKARLREVPPREYPDVVFAGYPPIETAAVMLRWAKKRAIPTVIDVKDQWPALFVEAFPAALRPLARIAFEPYFFLARRALRDATAFCSMSDAFVDWMANFAGRARTARDIVAPLSSPRPKVDAESLVLARQWWQSQGVDLDDPRRFAFVGSVSRAFDFEPIRYAAERMQRDGVRCQFVLCGTGDELESVRSSMSGLRNVVFPGWIDQPKIETLTAACAAMLAPYRSTENFTRNVPNKIVDAFAAGLPVVSGLDGEVRRLLEEQGTGVYVPDAESFDAALRRLLDDAEMRSTMGRRSRELYQRRFAFDRVYGDLVAALERLGSPRDG